MTCVLTDSVSGEQVTRVRVRILGSSFGFDFGSEFEFELGFKGSGVRLGAG